MNRTAQGKRGIIFKPLKFISALGVSFLLVFGQTAPLLGNPTGGAVVAGSATIGSAGSTLTINQSTASAIINWQQFSIAGGELTKFIVPNSASATLNRVLGGNPSQIYGTLQSNGLLYLVNPNGIVVGPGGVINTAGFMASTYDISNEQFLAGGNLNLSGTSSAAINNEGTIHASTGDVYLVADQVNNSGTITAPQGTAGLAAGTDILYQPAGKQHLLINATPAGTTRATGVTNTGTISAAAAELKAAGGNAYALAINNTGVIAATGYKKINGQVYLTSDGGSITNSGRISARTASGNGGKIVMNGTSSPVSVSSTSAKTSTTSGKVTNSGTLDASATVAGGQGGTVTIKNMDGTTIFCGQILARGGQGGAGGSAEVSGANLVFKGLVDLTAPGGTTGTLTLDPTTLNVVTAGTGTVLISGQNDSTSTTISPTTVADALSTANLILNADTNITISNGITWTSGNTLTLSTNTAGSSSIVINAPISGTTGTLIISAAGSDPITTGAAGTVNVANFILESGTWSQIVGQNGLGALPAFSASNNFELQDTSTFERFAGIDTANGNAYEIADVYGLQGLASPSQSLLSANAELVNNIDASGTSTWNAGAGFVPIGNYYTTDTAFSGTFDGQNHTINNLFIYLPNYDYGVGLFGNVTGVGAVIKNVGMTNVQIDGYEEVGGLVGYDDSGMITNCYTTGTVNGSSVDDYSYEVGGLVGYDDNGTINNCYTTTSVSGYEDVGGLVGEEYDGAVNNCYSTGSVTNVNGNEYYGDFLGGLIGEDYYGTISNCHSTGTVTGSVYSNGYYSYDVGGLVGYNYLCAISNSYSTGAVSGYYSVGGLVGGNDGPISNSYSTGAVNAASNVNNVYEGYYVGGLTGWNESTINNCYSTGNVTVSGTDAYYVGGLSGWNSYTGTISNCYSTGNVTVGTDCNYVGGLVGYNYDDYDTITAISNCYSTGTVTAGSGSTYVGGFVGYNYYSTISNSFWDTDTAGQTLGVGSDPTNTTAGVTGATTAQLESQAYILANSPNAPTWDFTTPVWTTNGDTTLPQLVGLPTSVPPVITLDSLSGTAFTDNGMTDSVGTTIDLIFGSTVLTATTNSNGGFTFSSLNPSDLTSGVLLTDTVDNGDTYYQSNSPAVSISGIDLWGDTLRVQADTASNSILGTAAGSHTVNYSVAGSNLTTNSGVSMTILRSYTLDGNITAAATLSATPGSLLDCSSDVTLTGASVSLEGTISGGGTPTIDSTASAATLNNATATNLSISGAGVTLEGTTNVGNLTINSTGGDLTQTGPLTAGLLTITGADNISLTNSGNNITTLGTISHTGSLTIYTDPGLTINSTITGNGPVTITETGGNITFGPNGLITDSGVGNNVILSAGTGPGNAYNIINDSTVGAILVSGGANYYLYSGDPADNSLGSLAPSNILAASGYSSSGLPAGNSEFYYVADTLPTTEIDPIVQSTQADLLPQPTVDTSPTPTVVNTDEVSTPPVTFAGTGIANQSGEQDNDMADTSGGAGQVVSGDTAQLGNGQLNNANNPHASGALNQALGTVVFQTLTDALQSAGDFTDADTDATGSDVAASGDGDNANGSDKTTGGDNTTGGGDNASGDVAAGQETILSGGDVAEVGDNTTKKIPLSKAPVQLQKALASDVLPGIGLGH